MKKIILISILTILSIPEICLSDIREIMRELHPSVTIQEEYNDNINLTHRNRKEDFITTLSPGLKYSTSRVTYGIDLDYRAGFVFYAKEDENNYISHNGNLNLWIKTSPELTFRVRDYLIRSDEIREREYVPGAIEGQYILGRTTRRVPYIRNIFEPSMEYKFGEENLVSLLYRNNIYDIESKQFRDSREDSINPALSYWFNVKNGILLEYQFTLGQFQRSPDLLGHMASGRYIYRFDPRTSMFVEHTFFSRNFESPNTDYLIHRPTIGIDHAFTPTMRGRGQIGYFFYDPERGSKKEGLFYNINFSKTAEKTVYSISFNGGYTEDYFSAENIGFTRYHRILGNITQMVWENFKVELLGSAERAKYMGNRVDNIWSVKAIGSYILLKWLTVSLEFSHRENHSKIDQYDYSEYRGLFKISATF